MKKFERLVPKGGETCQDCGCPYATVYRVPDEVWTAITPRPEREGGGLLCLDCADARAYELGLNLYWEAACGHFPTEKEDSE